MLSLNPKLFQKLSLRLCQRLLLNFSFKSCIIQLLDVLFALCSLIEVVPETITETIAETVVSDGRGAKPEAIPKAVIDVVPETILEAVMEAVVEFLVQIMHRSSLQCSVRSV